MTLAHVFWIMSRFFFVFYKVQIVYFHKAHYRRHFESHTFLDDSPSLFTTIVTIVIAALAREHILYS